MRNSPKTESRRVILGKYKLKTLTSEVIGGPKKSISKREKKGNKRKSKSAGDSKDFSGWSGKEVQLKKGKPIKLTSPEGKMRAREPVQYFSVEIDYRMKKLR